MVSRNRRVWMYIFILIIIEQTIKIIINSRFLTQSFPILPPVLYFKPIFNRNYSWFNSMLELGAGKWLHIGVVAVMSLLIYLFYRYLKNQSEVSSIINAMFIFIFSGALCSLIDKIVWNGSLDYIKVEGFFTFDLKDVYINVFNGLFVLGLFLKSKPLKQLENKGIFKGFVKYTLGKQNK